MILENNLRGRISEDNSGLSKTSSKISSKTLLKDRDIMTFVPLHNNTRITGK